VNIPLLCPSALVDWAAGWVTAAMVSRRGGGTTPAVSGLGGCGAPVPESNGRLLLLPGSSPVLRIGPPLTLNEDIGLECWLQDTESGGEGKLKFFATGQKLQCCQSSHRVRSNVKKSNLRASAHVTRSRGSKLSIARSKCRNSLMPLARREGNISSSSTHRRTESLNGAPRSFSNWKPKTENK
jgi:hypothetical protein